MIIQLFDNSDEISDRYGCINDAGKSKAMGGVPEIQNSSGAQKR